MKSLTPLLLLILATAAKADEVIQSVSLERTECYGWCPSYVVTITSTGDVTFEGRAFVEKKGIFHRKIDPGKFSIIVRELARLKFWDPNKEYKYKVLPDGSHESATDWPTKIVSVVSTTRNGSVEDYYGAPAGLPDLEHLIDVVAGDSEFIGDPNPRRR
jgi:hypothetical protein